MQEAGDASEWWSINSRCMAMTSILSTVGKKKEKGGGDEGEKTAKTYYNITKFEELSL